MATADTNGLLDMVEGMDNVLDEYLSGSATAFETVARVLRICARMRLNRLDAATRYWLGAIERRVGEIANARADDSDSAALSKRFVNTRLLQDIHHLRGQIVAIARAKKNRPARASSSWWPWIRRRGGASERIGREDASGRRRRWPGSS